MPWLRSKALYESKGDEHWSELLNYEVGAMSEVYVQAASFTNNATWLQAGGNIEDTEMMRTFNCGIGMILVVDQAAAASALEALAAQGVNGWELGHITDEATGVQFN